MKSRIQAGNVGPVPAPAEKRFPINKKTILALLAFLLGGMAGRAEQADLKQLKAGYESSLQALDAREIQLKAELIAGYTNGLQAVRSKAQQAGDLDTLKTVLAEVVRATTERSLPTEIPALPEVRTLVLGYRQRLQELAQGWGRNTLAQASHYDKALEALQRKLTQEGKLDEATAVQKERKDLVSSEAVVRARVALGAGPAAAASNQTAGVAVQLSPSGQPVALKGTFHVAVDDFADIYVGGRLIHHAKIGQSVSPETTVRLGDCVTAGLRNKVSHHTFAVAFLSTDGQYVINFRQEDCRELQDTQNLNLSPKEFDALSLKPVRERPETPLPFPFKTDSEWMWGRSGKSCVLSAIVTRAMIVKRQP